MAALFLSERSFYHDKAVTLQRGYLCAFNIDKFEPLKYHYKDGFISVPLWDADFLRHKASGYILDFRYLQTITVYDDFVALCQELEAFENN